MPRRPTIALLRRSPAAWLLLPVLVLTVAACSTPTGNGGWTFPPTTPPASGNPIGSGAVAREATMYRSPTCGCCGEYATYLENAGWTVRIRMTEDTTALKQQHGIPQAAWSCHTMTVEGYVIEGHVPLEAIEDLLAARPAVDGIALPGMPAGSPGMSGVKDGDFVVVSIRGDVLEEFGRY